MVRGTPSGVPGSFRPGRPTRVLLPPQLAWPRAVAVPQRKELMHDHCTSVEDPRIRAPPLLTGSGIASPSFLPPSQPVHPRTEAGVS